MDVDGSQRQMAAYLHDHQDKLAVDVEAFSNHLMSIFGPRRTTSR